MSERIVLDAGEGFLAFCHLMLFTYQNHPHSVFSSSWLLGETGVRLGRGHAPWPGPWRADIRLLPTPPPAIPE